MENLSLPLQSRCRLRYPSSASSPSPPRAGASLTLLLPLMVQRPRPGLGGVFWVPSCPNQGTASCREGALSHPGLAPVPSNGAVMVRGWSVREAALPGLRMRMDLQLLVGFQLWQPKTRRLYTSKYFPWEGKSRQKHMRDCTADLLRTLAELTPRAVVRRCPTPFPWPDRRTVPLQGLQPRPC